MKHTIVFISFSFLLLFFSTTIVAAQNINGSNNTVIIQMQGNNNSVNNSNSNYNYSSSSNYNASSNSKSTPSYSDTPSSYFLAYYTYEKWGSVFEKKKKWALEFYKNGTYRLTTPDKITEGIFESLNDGTWNNTFTLYVYVNGVGYVKDRTLTASQGKMKFSYDVVLRSTIPHTELK